LTLTCVSAFHYILITGQKLHTAGANRPSAPSSR
jgi:hypothetical protein